MTKRQLIDEILTINRSAEPGFLARFDDSELGEYLEHLKLARQPRLGGDARRYDKYFHGSSRPAWQTTPAVAQTTEAVALADEELIAFGGADDEADAPAVADEPTVQACEVVEPADEMPAGPIDASELARQLEATDAEDEHDMDEAAISKFASAQVARTEDGDVCHDTWLF